ncbi:hypothetical protein G7K71_02475 [Desulfofundulus sp. TPOSR]|uniref:Hpt protein n=1 Tax=Desulfofundulus kuznetsovii (strain DSM 6115 / VKM B-1805 / 17) TaxID=760568 RepID=A0AAU8P9K1_DESK7|nr:Hpt domain-containing protein [Desulfofundulus sp. TPOSR]AEG14613.1 Hpt protein [Desulfofundulus kuznetsovii DSM 6115]NHM25892.1 hypothetical protein [Desulfofundulus sp. TPOSR]
MYSEESLPYVEAFLEETAEQLQELESKLVFLEKNPTDRTCIDDIFRIAHNLKGNAATVGFEEMASLAHRMEDLLDGMRKGKISSSGEIIDTLLNSLDALKGLADKFCGKDEGILELSNLVNKLEHLAHGGHDAGAHTGPKKILIKLEDGCDMKAVRACVVIRALEELVEIVEVKPSFDEIKEHGFEGTEIKARFFARESLDTVKEALQAIPDVKAVELSGEEKTLNIRAGARLDPRIPEERLRNADRAVVDLTDLRELSPAALSWLLRISRLAKVKLILPQQPLPKKFLKLLGLGESDSCSGTIPGPATAKEA